MPYGAVASIFDRTVLVGETDFKQENVKAIYFRIMISARKEMWNVPGVLGETDLRQSD